MTLPVNTGLEFHARQPTSAAEIFAAKRERDRKWGIGKAAKRKPVSLPEKRVEPVKAVQPIRSPGRAWPHQHDSHVMAFYEWKGNPPLAYLKRRCRETGASYDEIVGKGRTRAIVKLRQKLICEVSVRFPHLSRPHIGRMFNRDHSTIIHALNRGGALHAKRPPIGYHVETIRRLFEANESLRSIARAVDYDHATVGSFIKRMGWTR